MKVLDGSSLFWVGSCTCVGCDALARYRRIGGTNWCDRSVARCCRWGLACGFVDNALALPTNPQAPRPQLKGDLPSRSAEPNSSLPTPNSEEPGQTASGIHADRTACQAPGAQPAAVLGR